MADPLSITASVVSIAVPALEGAKLLMDDLQKIKDAPKAVKRLEDDVRSVETALTALRGVEDREWDLLGATVTEQSSTTISSCTQACNLFRTDLQRWTAHSEGGKLAWQDRAKVGFFKQSQVKAMSEQLQNCKLSINSVVSIASLYSSVRHAHITEEIQKTIAAMQAEITGSITTADKQLIVLESKLEEINLSSDAEEAAGGAEGRTEALRQLQEENNALNASRKLLEELLSKSQEAAVAKVAAGNSTHTTTVTFGNNYSGIQAHTINGGVSSNFGSK